MDKIVSVYTSKPDDAVDPLRDAVNDLKDCGGFDELLEKSTAAWKEIWDEIDIRVTGDRSSQKLLRLHLYHLIVSMGPHNAAIDASITARGLHGEAYRGHIFWDELFILPLYNMHLPETAKAMLMYRYNRLAEAKKYAARYGYKGAMFPWQSGSDGREETQVIHLNPLSGNWDPDHSSLQRHVSLAIAYNVWQYFNMTDDVEFMQACGAEMFFEICRFWASKCEAGQNGRYNVKKVMGPDEFHEQYPGSDEGGLKDNAYTNLMVAWMFRKASVIRDMIGDDAFGRLGGRMGIRIHEISDWIEVSGKLNLCIDPEGIIAQYDGYFDLKELDWDLYRQKYKNIYRLDRILKAENLSPDEFKVAKQADMLMTFYNLDKEEVDGLLAGMGYTLPADYLQRNLEYYLQRTSHGSTLSRVVHAKLGLMAGDFDLSWKLYSEALASDLNDIQGGTTGEGIHAGVMAGTVLIALTVYAGINLNGEVLRIDPILPPVWKEIEFGITFKGVRYRFVLTSGSIRIMAGADAKVMVKGQEVALEAGMERVIA
jgi:trehalose/maltose hydrolase-like predicted phosphorylase